MRFRVPRGTKFEARALEGVMLETLDYGVYKVLVDDNTVNGKMSLTRIYWNGRVAGLHIKIKSQV